jgi:hypothetical protein
MMVKKITEMDGLPARVGDYVEFTFGESNTVMEGMVTAIDTYRKRFHSFSITTVDEYTALGGIGTKDIRKVLIPREKNKEWWKSI